MILEGLASLLASALSCDPALSARFTPLHPGLGHYEVCTTAESMDGLVREESGRAHYGAAETLEPLDAFGTAGP